MNVLISAWGRMSRWERKDRIGEPLQLTGSFAAVGILAQSGMLPTKKSLDLFWSACFSSRCAAGVQ